MTNHLVDIEKVFGIDPAQLEDQSVNRNEPSARIRRELKPTNPLFLETVKRVFHEVLMWRSQQATKPTRELRREHYDSLYWSVECLCTNLYINHAIWPIIKQRVPKGTNEFTVWKETGAKTFLGVYEALIELGYIELQMRGYWDIGQSEYTRVIGTAKFIEAFEPTKAQITEFRPQVVSLINVRDEDKDNHFYDPKRYKGPSADKRVFDKATSNLKRINKVMINGWPDICVPDKEFITIQNEVKERAVKDMLDKKRPARIDRQTFVDLTQRQYYRVFNNGKADHGGRFYGVWWQTVRSEYRKFITIDGKLTVEVDFSAYHPTMIYQLAGKELPAKPYHIDLTNYGIHVDAMFNYEEIVRPQVKAAFNAMVNAKDRRIEEPNDYPEGLTSLITWDKLREIISKEHEAIRDKFYTGAGVELQRYDSDIAERVMLHFSKKEVPCLCVHDSFLVVDTLENELKEVMQEAYRWRMKMEPPALESKHSGLMEIPSTEGYERYFKRNSRGIRHSK